VFILHSAFGTQWEGVKTTGRMNPETPDQPKPSLGMRSGREISRLATPARSGTGKDTDMISERCLEVEASELPRGRDAKGIQVPPADSISKQLADRLPPVRLTGPLIVPPSGKGI
jgi:hypothetical protein